MKKELENLWFNYLIEAPIKRSNEENIIINKLTEKDKLFRSILNEEQIRILNEYDDVVSQVGRISEKNAFIKGVMFATRFILEALCEK